MKTIRPTLVVVLLGLLALSPFGARADYSASFTAFLLGCPGMTVPPGGLLLPSQASCTAATAAAMSAMQQCQSTGVMGPVGDTCTNSNRIDWGSGNPQAGSYPVAYIGPSCPDGQGAWEYPPFGILCGVRSFPSQPNLGRCLTCDGNPVNPAIGNKFQIETDYTGNGPFPLKFERVYNAREPGDVEAGARMGHKWTHTYGRYLMYDPANPDFRWVKALREDGRLVVFDRSYGYAPEYDFVGVVERLEPVASGWMLTNAQDEIELYDTNGRLTSIANREGLTQTLAYDGSGRLLSVTDPFGRALTFTYDSRSRIASMTTPAGTYQYAYDAGPGQILVTITYPDAHTRTYVYEHPGLPQLLTGIVDENGQRFSTYAYDGDGKAISTEHAGGAGKVTFEHNNSPGTRDIVVKRYTTSTDFVARTYNYLSVRAHAAQTGVQGDPCPSCGNPASTYDNSANISSTTDWNGNRTNYTFDARHVETSRTEGLTAGGGTTAQTRTITTEWHTTFRLRTRIAEPLRIMTYVYDADGTQCGARAALCSKSIQATTDASGVQGFSATASGTPRTWTYTYNANGQVLAVNGPRTDAADITAYTYYANDDADLGKRGNIATVTNAAGHVTQIAAYNANGQPLTIVDPNGLTTTMTYDARQRLTSRSVGGETTSYDYDFAGQLTKATLPDGSFLSYSYDAAHRLIGMQDNLGNRIAYTLDLMGNRTQEQVFDPSNALAQTRSRVYSSINRLFREVGAIGQTTEYAYDDQGNVTSVKDPLNHTTANQYDALNRLKQVTDPNSGVTQYAYNGLDALTQVTDPRSLATGYSVDGLGNLNQQTSPDTGTTASTYDTAGNLLTQTDAKSQTTAYAYDALNRVTLIAFHDGSKQAYAYDQGPNALGRLSSITERNPANQIASAIAYAYEQHGRVTSETRTINTVTYVTAYQYDSAGRLSGVTYPSGRAVAYAFDAAGRVNQVATTKDSQTQTVVSSVAYHPFGGVKGFTLGNGQRYTRGYDQDGRVASYSLGAAQYAIGYDAASRITFISDINTPANSNTYGYDALDRLTSAVLPATPFAYSYDAVGNRQSKTVGSATDSYAYEAASNRIASLTPASGAPRSFVFDANGSTTNDGLNSFAYDTRGRMVQATSSVGTTSYQVNALGQRVRKTNSSTDTVFHYDARGRLIGESDPAGAVLREYVYLADMPVLIARPVASSGTEVVLDNGTAAFSVTGTWPLSTAVAGFVGPNYQTHEANGPSPAALVVDNTDSGFSVSGTWPTSTAVTGYVGANYQVHAANGEPAGAIVADNSSGSATGTWPTSTSVAGYYGTNYQVHTAGTGANVFTWTLNVPAAGTYPVYARWTSHPNRATNAKYTVHHASGNTVVSVNMEQNSAQWNLLGSFSFNAGAATVSLSDDANEYVVADAVMIVPPGAGPNTATWALSVPASGSYQVYARWTAHPNRATDAKYTVNHAAGSTVATVNQEQNSGLWNSLGAFTFNAGTATVTLTDQANGYVIADAVMLAPPGAAPNSATWTPNVAQAGSYQLYARWTQHANRATNATYTVTHASGSTDVTVNQQANGGAWNALGTFTLSPGTVHKITLTDQANGYVIADAIRLVPLSVSSGSQYYFAHVDHLNTPRAIFDVQQQLRWKWDQQEPFGVNGPDENPSALGTFEFPIRFAGQSADKETNLTYNYFRDYDAATGRYVESDPVGLQAGLNTYLYVNGLPIRYVDPRGETALAAPGAAIGTLIFPGIGTAVGAAAGAGLSVIIYYCLAKSADCGAELTECNLAIAKNGKNINCFRCYEKCVGSGKWPKKIPLFTTSPGNYYESCVYD